MSRRRSSPSSQPPPARPPPPLPKPPDIPNLLNLSSSSCTGQAASGLSSELDSMDSDDEPDPDAETLDPLWLVGVNSRRSKTSLPLAGIKLEVVNTNAKELASTVDINSLGWTVLGVRVSIYAALAIVKDGPTATDVSAVEWIQTGGIHFGLTISYYGFASDVLELWYTEPSAWDVENSIELPGPPEVIETGPRRQTMTPRLEEKWVAMKEQFLGIMVCNHFCRTVQSSQVVAHNSEDDDGTMDMLLFHGCGRLRLMRFLQTSRHLSLPYVECVKVKSSSPVKPLPPFGELLITGYGPFMVNLRRTLLLFVTNICGTHRKFNKVPFVRVSNRYCSIHSPPRCFLLWLYRLLRIQHLASTFPPLTMPWYARRCYLRGCFPGTEARRSFIIECSRWFRLACQFDCLLGSETRRSRNRPPLLYSSWMKRLIQSIVAVVAAQAPLLICSLLRVEESLKLDFKMIKTDVFSSEIAWIFFNLSFIAYVYVLFMELRASEIWMTRFVTR